MVAINQNNPGPVTTAYKVPVAETWGVFSSPCEGVVWDRNLHGWTACPADGASRPQPLEPEVFSPAELGMEGAKLAAIRRRREMEAQVQVQIPQRPGDEEKVVSAEPLAAWPGEVEGGSRDVKVRQAANDHPKVLPKSRTRSASPPVQQRTSATAPSGTTAARKGRSSSPVQVQCGQGRMSLGRVRQASPETSPKSAARPAAKASAGGRTPSPASQLTRQPAKVRLDGKRRPEVKGVDSQVMSQLNALWQKVEELEDKVERERSQKEELRSEKEELRRENQQLQHRLEVLMVDPVHGGASSVPVEEPSWSVTRSPPMQERRVSDVTPIVAPSPPKSLNAFRQVTAIRQDAPRELVALHSRSAPLRQSLVSSGSLRNMSTLGGYHSLQAQTPLRAVPVPFNGPPIARHTLRPIAPWPGR